MRLNKYLARSGVGSRRETDKLIQAATVTVNGSVMTNPAYQVRPGDIVAYDGRVVTPDENRVVLLLHKPAGYITTMRDPQGRKTVLDLLPGSQRLFPIGRLDKDTTGLLLVTNDGDLANKLMHPRNQIPRIYQAEIEGRLSDATVQKIKRGIFIGENTFGRAEVIRQKTVKKRSQVTLCLHHGKKREIRRIFEFLHIKLYSLIRIQFGPIMLGDLPPGRYRELTKEEVANLLRVGKTTRTR
ncbi:MAG: pseudouridine synthase [Fidelibacterota bacterium]